MTLLIGAATIGFILALLGLGVFISYRVYDTLDLTADGSFGVGAAVAAALLVRGMPPMSATVIGALSGAVAGTITGLVHTKFLVSTLLAGVLTSTALYSVSLFVMGSGNLSLASAESLATWTERAGQRLLGIPSSLTLLGTTVSGGSVATLVMTALLVGGLALGLAVFLGTNLGLAMRAAGSNPTMAKALAIDVDLMVVLGLALANGLIGLAGGLCGPSDGHRGASERVGEPHGGRGVGREAFHRALDRRGGRGRGGVPPAGRGCRARRPQPECPEAGHRSVRARRINPAAPGEPNPAPVLLEWGGNPCLRSCSGWKASPTPSIPEQQARFGPSMGSLWSSSGGALPSSWGPTGQASRVS
jgi:ABC-type uncharacterized transport system permease subunit